MILDGIGGAILGFFLSYPHLKYVALAPVSLIEGPLISLAAGFFVRLDYLEWLPALLFLALGEIVGDVIWYVIGIRWGGGFVRRFGPWFSIEEEEVEAAKKLFIRYHTSILFFTKVTMGLGLSIPVLFTAGLTRVPFGWFMTISVTGQLIWTAFLMGLGYYLGQAFLEMDSLLGRISLFTLVAGILLALFFLARRLRRRFVGKAVS